MARTIEADQLSQDVQREVARKQQQIIQRYQKRLGAKAGASSKKMVELQTFLESGKQVGSSHFLKLSPVVQEVVIQLNLSGIEIMRKHTKNPFKKAQLWLSNFMIKRLVPSMKKKNTKKPAASKKGKGKKKGQKQPAQKEFLSSRIKLAAIISGIIAIVGWLIVNFV